MFSSTTKKIAAVLLSAGLLASVTVVHAKDDAPMKIVIGFPAGGALDNMTRALAEKLRLELNRPIIVENRPGAGTQLAVRAVANSDPNGNTILISPATPFVLFPLTYDSLPYDPDKDLVPVAHLADTPLVASTSVDSPYSSMQEYIDWVRKHPNQSGVGMVSLGGTLHFGLLRLNQNAGLQLMPVAYKGAPAMLADEIGGILPIGLDAVAAKSELERAGRIRYLGVSGTERSKLLPNVPTLLESGAPGFELSSGWYAAFVPAGTPAATVEKLEKAMIEIVQDPEFAEKMAQLGMETTGRTSSDLASSIKSQREKWRPIVEQSGFRANQ